MISNNLSGTSQAFLGILPFPRPKNPSTQLVFFWCQKKQGSFYSLTLSPKLRLEGTFGLFHTPIWPSFWKNIDRQVLTSRPFLRTENLRAEENQLPGARVKQDRRGAGPSTGPCLEAEGLHLGGAGPSPSLHWLSALRVCPRVTAGSCLHGPAGRRPLPHSLSCFHPPSSHQQNTSYKTSQWRKFPGSPVFRLCASIAGGTGSILVGELRSCKCGQNKTKN